MHRTAYINGTASVASQINGADNARCYTWPKKICVPYAVIVTDNCSRIFTVQNFTKAFLYRLVCLPVSACNWTNALVLSVCGIALAAAGYSHAGEKNYSPYVNQSFPQNVYFGDTHLHTSYSTDAGMVGNTTTPEQAYRVAKGQLWLKCPRKTKTLIFMASYRMPGNGRWKIRIST